MDFCPKCNSKLSADEKFSGRCFKCNASFEEFAPDENKRYPNTLFSNSVSKAIKICGIIIIIVGTIISIINGCQKDIYQEITFSFLHFISSEAISVISGIFFIGLSEIIQLLEDIKNKTR